MLTKSKPKGLYSFLIINLCRMKMLTVCFIFFRGMQNENVDCLFYFFQRYAEWKCWLCFIFFRGMQNENVDCLFYFFQRYAEYKCRLFYFFQRFAEWKCWLFILFFSEICRMKMLTVCFIMSPPTLVGRHIVFVLSVCPSQNLSAQLLWNYWTEFHETW